MKFSATPPTVHVPRMYLQNKYKFRVGKSGTKVKKMRLCRNVRHEGELVRARCAEKDVQDTQKVENLLLEMMKTSRFS